MRISLHVVREMAFQMGHSFLDRAQALALELDPKDADYEKKLKAYYVACGYANGAKGVGWQLKRDKLEEMLGRVMKEIEAREAPNYKAPEEPGNGPLEG